MTAKADPGEWASTHDLILTLGSTTVPLVLCDRNGNRNPLAFTRNPINRNSLKMYAGTQKYADLEPPWTPVAQTDWSGGRGSKDFDKDESMYYDGYNINTLRPGEIILGPKATSTLVATSTSNTEGSTYGSISGLAHAETKYYAYKFTAGATIDVVKINLILYGINTMQYSYTIQVGLSNLTGAPEAPGTEVFATPTYILINGTTQTYSFDIASYSLTSGTGYALVIKAVNLTGYPSADPNVNPVIYFKNSTTAAGSCWTSADATTWVATDNTVCPYFVMEAATYSKSKYFFFEYKGAMFAIGRNDAVSTSKLYLNGDHGVCETTNTTTSVIKTHSGYKHWAVDEAIGCILKLVSGTGSDQPQPWRIITDNDAHSDIGADAPGRVTCSFTVSPPFDKAPADDTVFAIVASDDWTEIKELDGNTFATDYSTSVITDVLVANGSVYLARGDSSVPVAFRANDESGLWTYTFSGTSTDVAAESAGSEFTYLAQASDQAGTYIWGAKGGSPSTVSYATAVDNTGFTGANEVLLGAFTAVNVGELGERVRGLEVYGDYGNLHVLKEGSIWQIIDKKPYRIDIREMGNTLDYRNGMGHTVHGKYLYFTWHDTVMRYIEGYLDRVGPDKAEVGWPSTDRAGHFSCLTGYYGTVLGGINASDGTSSVMAYNGQGWCELYSAISGNVIQNIYIQSIPGNTVDRLWISAGSDLVWIPLSIDPFNHPGNSYVFAYDTTDPAGYLITSWYYLGLNSIDKLFNSLKMVIENAQYTSTSDFEHVRAFYQVDDEATWNEITTSALRYDTFSEEFSLSSTYAMDGKRIRFKFALYSYDGAETPRIIASVLEAAVRVPNKYVTSVMCRLEDYDTQRDGAPDDVPLAITKFNNLVTMQASAVPVSIQSALEMIDGKYAFVDSVSPIALAVNDKEGKKNKYAVSFSLIEVS